jgi:peptidoglycan/xylan/chitin deacetylase (PgdA/CDA1 family)
MMRREHILQLIGEVEFGLHSFEHATMTAESEHYLRDDLSRCRIWWNELTGRDPEIYAFPNGAAEEHHVSIVCEAGYSTVLLVGEHLSRPNHNIHPRLTMFGRTGAEVRVRALGGPWFFLRKGSAMEVGPVR